MNDRATSAARSHEVTMGIGTTELLVILLIALLIFGGSRIATLGRGLGEGLRNFKDALRGDEPKPPVKTETKKPE
jgi:sec-independent protein translocase protein TatA